MSWLFSQALVEEYSAGTSLAGAPSAQLNVMPTPHKFWRNDKTMESSKLSQFGLTLQPLTDAHGAELLMSYLAASRVRTSVLRGGATALTVLAAGCGASLQGSLARYDHPSSSWKTAQCSLLEEWELFSETWPDWGSMLNGALYLRPIPMHLTLERESGLLPTLCARDHRYPGKSRLERTGSKAGEVLPQIVGGPLNPAWCEWFMGFPLGWTELKPLAMPRFQEWQQQHGGF